jgi:hypothetical protein
VTGNLFLGPTSAVTPRNQTYTYDPFGNSVDLFPGIKESPQSWNRYAYVIPKARINVGGRTRIPDELTPTMLREVKNVESLSLTQQLRDLIEFSQQNGLQFILEVRQGTQLSGPLQTLVAEGLILLRRTLP